MPIVDMPVRVLEAYMGSSPRPRDFDEYWARALAALDAQNLRRNIFPQLAEQAVFQGGQLVLRSENRILQLL